MHTTYKKIILTSLTITAFFLYGAVIVFATPPTTKYAPGEILDPACAPLDPNCSVTTGWEFDVANNYLFNTTDKIGIGTNTPATELDVAGDISQLSTLPSGGFSIFNTGDLTAYGGNEGYNFLVVDSFAPTAVGSMTLDLRTNEPRASLMANSSTFQTSLRLDSSDGGIDMQADGGGDIHINTNTGGNIYLHTNASGDINLNAKMVSLFATEVLALSSKNAWQGGVDADPSNINIGDYQVDFSMNPYAATPAIVWEMKKNQNYALGYAALDDFGNKKYSNIYYGVLDGNNIINDITRVEAADIGASMMYKYNQVSNYTNYLTLGSSGINMSTQDVSGGHDFSLLNNGDIRASVLAGAGITGLSADINGNIVRTPSDEKLKTNIETLNGSLARVMQLNPVSYNWKDPQRFGDQTEIGFIAQQIENIVPEVVSSGGEYKSVNYQVLTALNAGAIKELALQISNKAGDLIDTVREIFVKKVTTEELCIGDICFDEQEAQTLKQMMQEGQINSHSENSEDEIITQEDILDEIDQDVAQDVEQSLDNEEIIEDTVQSLDQESEGEIDKEITQNDEGEIEDEEIVITEKQ